MYSSLLDVVVTPEHGIDRFHAGGVLGDSRVVTLSNALSNKTKYSSEALDSFVEILLSGVIINNCLFWLSFVNLVFRP